MIRKATPDDLDALMVIENTAFAHTKITRNAMRRWIVSQTATLLVADEHCTVAGYALLLHPKSAIPRLYSIAVLTGLTGKGIGSALLTAAETAAGQRLRLEVHADNAKAIALYRKRGYYEIGYEQHFYEDGGTAIKFERRIS